MTSKNNKKNKKHRREHSRRLTLINAMLASTTFGFHDTLNKYTRKWSDS